MNPTSPNQSMDSRILRDRRKSLIAQSAGVFGLLRASMTGNREDGFTLRLEFIEDRSDGPKVSIPSGLNEDTLAVTCIDAPETSSLRVRAISPAETSQTLIVELTPTHRDPPSDPGGLYRVTIHGIGGVDPEFSSIEYAIGVQRDRSEPVSNASFPKASSNPRPSSYLSRDGEGFRQLMLERMRSTLPQWQERNPADLGVTLIEGVAHAADLLSYYQDAVGTEAYADTARQRVSLRRHGRLLGVRPSDGTGARTWLTFEVTVPTRISPGTRVGTQPLDRRNAGVATRSDIVFQTVASVSAHPEQNTMIPHCWGIAPVVIEAGSTTLTLKGHLSSLREGDVVFIVDGEGETGAQNRHAVRLTRPPVMTHDQTTNTDITQIQWSRTDALPFNLHIHDGNDASPRTVVVGNSAIAKQGERIQVPSSTIRIRDSSVHVRLAGMGSLCFDAEDPDLPASDQRFVNTATAIHDIEVHQTRPDGRTLVWTCVADLLGSSPIDRHFVAELTNSMDLELRFGDGRCGLPRPPGNQISVLINAGHGQQGNVGPDALRYLHTVQSGLRRARNPMPATGGTRPDTLEEARARIMRPIRSAHACVEPSDYAELAAQHPHIRQAQAKRSWAGTWPCMTVHLLSESNDAPSDQVLQEIKTSLDTHRRIGVRVDVRPAAVVHVDISVHVVVDATVPEPTIRRRMLETLGSIPCSSKGFFHPSNWEMGQPVYEAPLVRCLSEIQGVRWLETVRFTRRDDPTEPQVKGLIDIQAHEVARIDSRSIQINLEVRRGS